MLIKLDDIMNKLHALHDDGESIEGMIHRGELREALAALPTVSVSEEMVNVAAKALCEKLDAIENDWHGFTGLARAALEAALGATVSNGWEDIATASKGEMILGHADGMVRLVIWEGGRWVQVGATIEPGWFEPTEWKPLGPLPAPLSE